MKQFFNSRIEADHLQKIDIFWLKKNGLLKNYYSPSGIVWKRGEYQEKVSIEVNLVENLREYLLGLEEPRYGFVRLIYKVDDKKYDYKIPLTITDCNYGGFRYWFLCPTCSKRVGVLYSRSAYFVCRHCNYLTYESKNISGRQKAFGRIISFNELDNIQSEVKRRYYNGKITRKYQRFLTMEKRADAAFFMGLGLLAS